MLQKTDEWKLARLGKVTASRVSDVMSNGAGKKTYMLQLLSERLTGYPEESFQSAAMLRGIELEPVARAEYEILNGIVIGTAGSIAHPSVDNFCASPDGMVGEDGLLEIKCPGNAAHIDFLMNKEIPAKYQWQMLAQMECTGRQWCDFASYSDLFQPSLQLAVRRFYRDEGKTKEMLEAVNLFLAELSHFEKRITEINKL